MRAYRICLARFAALDGEGARLHGGRWNSPGRAAVYLSSTLALAALEYLVHIDPDNAPIGLIALTVDIPDKLMADAESAGKLPKGWERSTGSAACMAMGDAWLTAGRSAVLRVPSALVPEESNLLINPTHTDSRRLRVLRKRAFSFDPRLQQ